MRGFHFSDLFQAASTTWMSEFLRLENKTLKHPEQRGRDTRSEKIVSSDCRKYFLGIWLWIKQE